MPNVKDYEDYKEMRAAYGFTSLDFVTWFSWHINVSRAVMKIPGR